MRTLILLAFAFLIVATACQGVDLNRPITFGAAPTATASPKIPPAWETFREMCEASGQMRAKLNADGSMSCEPIGQLPAPTEAPKTIAVQPTATPVPPTATPKPVAPEIKPAGPTLPMTGKLFLSPVKATSVFNQESAWLIAEPGRICTPECPWTLMSIDAPYAGNAQEGGFLYVSVGQLTLVVDGIRFGLPYQDGNNNIVLIRGRIDDGKIDTDLNTTVQLTGFKPGHGIFTLVPVGAYVSKNWFRQQLQVSMNVHDPSKAWSNCGALGCSKTTILLFDVDSHSYQKFVVYARNIDDWNLMETNMR